MTEHKVVICPYCGETQAPSERCRGCGGFFEPLSRQATHNAMGPWFIRDPAKPFHPGCSYETLSRMIDRGQVTRNTIIRGPTTRQFWTIARRVQGVAHLLGCCHNCDAAVHASDHGCHACGVPFGTFRERDSLGLPEVRPLPWQGGAEEAAGPPVAGGSLAGSISRFASDEELLHPALAGRPAATAPRPAAAGSHGAGETVFDDHASSAVTRALRRKVAHQERTIRLMMIVLIAALAIAIGTSIIPLASRMTGAGDAPQSPDDAGSAAAPSGPQGEPMQEAPELDAGAFLESAPGAAEPAQGGPTASVFDEAYANALSLISLGERTDRPLDDRIGDYERALESLRGIDAAAPGDDRPHDLDARIASVEHELERLRLERDFFG